MCFMAEAPRREIKTDLETWMCVQHGSHEGRARSWHSANEDDWRATIVLVQCAVGAQHRRLAGNLELTES